MIPGRKTKAVELFGEKLFLAERDAYNVLELQAFIKKNELDEDDLIYLFHLAKALEDALKFNARTIPKWRVFHWLKIRRICKARYLLENLQVAELAGLFTHLLRLENGGEDPQEKKKGD